MLDLKFGCGYNEIDVEYDDEYHIQSKLHIQKKTKEKWDSL